MTQEGGERTLRVLLVEDSEDDALLLVRELRRTGYIVDVDRVVTAGSMKDALDRQDWDVVIADYRLPNFSGPAALDLLKQRDLDLPCIIVSGTVSEDLAVDALKSGAHDFVAKGNLSRLAPAIARGLREVEERRVRVQAEEALRQSEERYRELVENASDVVFTVDLQGNFTSLNAAGEHISGYSRSELAAMNMADVLPPESLRLAYQMIQQKLVEDRPTVYELEMTAKDGHRVALELSTRLICHRNQPIGIQGIARDITERRRAAQALRESEERYRGLFENASDIVYTHDLQGIFTSINKAAERVMGYRSEEIVGSSLERVVAPEQVQLAHSMIRQKLLQGTTTTYELEVLAKDGRKATLEINSQLIYNGGQPVGVQGIARDVTERRRAEADLRSRERKQAALAGLGQRALAHTDLRAVFDDAVAVVADTLGVEHCTVTELLGGGALLVRAGTGWRPGLVGRATIPAGSNSQAGYTLQSGEPVIVEDYRTETRFCPSSILAEHDISSGMSAIVHGQERPFGVLSAFARSARTFTQDDVNFLQVVANILATAIERTRLEAERARQTRELATRVIQAQEEERKRIARELHDETAQSLSMLLTHLDLLEPHIPADHEALAAGFERVAALARRTLDETRALSHDLRPTILDDVGLVAALQWLAAEFEQTFRATVHVHAEGQVEGALSSEVEVALFRIAQEAVNNVGKHASADEVRIALLVDETRARLEVEDNGRGFDPARVPKPTRQGRLGLYGMNERAELLGGTLSVVRRPGGGTGITVQVPLRRVDEAVDRSAQSRRLQAVAP